MKYRVIYRASFDPSQWVVSAWKFEDPMKAAAYAEEVRGYEPAIVPDEHAMKILGVLNAAAPED